MGSGNVDWLAVVCNSQVALSCEHNVCLLNVSPLSMGSVLFWLSLPSSQVRGHFEDFRNYISWTPFLHTVELENPMAFTELTPESF